MIHDPILTTAQLARDIQAVEGSWHLDDPRAAEQRARRWAERNHLEPEPLPRGHFGWRHSDVWAALAKTL